MQLAPAQVASQRRSQSFYLKRSFQICFFKQTWAWGFVLRQARNIVMNVAVQIATISIYVEFKNPQI